MTTRNGEADEETCLLPKVQPTPTTLEWSQISIILLLQMCEPLTSQSIYPYINQLIWELDITGGDKRKVGYYAGLIESLFFVTEAMTVLHWSRISDHVGRKPVLLTGLMGLCISMISFGLSRTFWSLVVSRCICGMLNGNIGVMKSVMGELTDSTNRAEGFSLMPVVWSAGATLGPLIGGGLSRPHERFPKLFQAAFWEQFPYFLPCAAVATFVASAFVTTFITFRETLQNHTPQRSFSNTGNTPQVHCEAGPVPLRGLLVYRVLISVSNYVVLAFLNIGLVALQPLFFAMPVEIGGLGLDPPAIGYILGGYGAATGLFQVFFFAKIIRRLGPKRVFFTGMSTFIPVFALFPIMSIVAQRLGNHSPFIWLLLASQLALGVIMDMAYGCIFMFITSAAPNKRSLGSTNGLAQTAVSIARAIGPAMATSLFSFSVEHNVLGGYGVYLILILLSMMALSLAARLPEKEWDKDS